MTTRHRVLVVDDDDDIRETLTHVLIDEGCEVTQASNGREALDLLEAGARPCLILLDLMMPVMDGKTFREHQIADPRIASIPVVLLTAAAGFRVPSDRFDAVFAKPVTFDVLVAVLDRYCRPG